MSSTVGQKTSPLFIQKVYSRTRGDEDLLEFSIQGNAKGHMLLEGVSMHLTVKIPPTTQAGLKLLPQNMFGLKQFSSMEIRINGEPMHRRSTAGEFFLSGYFQYILNYSSDYITSACNTFGIFDNRNLTTKYLKAAKAHDKPGFDNIIAERKNHNNHFEYEIIMPLDIGIFTSNGVLPTDTPVELSIERAPAKYSLLWSDDITSEDITKIPHFLQLEDVYLTVPFVQSSSMERLEKNMVERPIPIKYDGYQIQRFNVNSGSANIRLANIINGPLPKRIFWGLMSENSYTGSMHHSATLFQRFAQIRATIYVDGNCLSGYPVTMSDNAISQPYTKFIQNSNRYLNCYTGKVITPREFSLYHFIHSAELPDAAGSLTFDFDFENALASELVLITCSVYERTCEIDHFRNFRIY